MRAMALSNGTCKCTPCSHDAFIVVLQIDTHSETNEMMAKRIASEVIPPFGDISGDFYDCSATADRLG